jgi:hypothetical protein
MNSINTVIHQQTHRVAQNSALRKAAAAPQPPSLTADESTLIQQKFSASKTMRSYSMDGRVNEHQVIRGSNFDARV